MAVKDYKDKFQDLLKKSGHEGYYYIHAIFVLGLYELMLYLWATPHVGIYNSGDIWFFPPFRCSTLGVLSVFVSLTLISMYAWNLYVEVNGIKTPKELEKDKKDKKEFEKFPYNKPLGRKFKAKEKEKFKPQWRYLLFTVGLGFWWASILFIGLRFLTFFLAVTMAGYDFIPLSLDEASFLRHYHTNPGQDLALAFGAGFYEEFIYRGLLFGFMAGWVKPRLKEDYFVFDVAGYKAGFMKMGKKTHEGLLQIVAAIIAAAIYALLHEVVGSEHYSLYTFVYRFLFGLALSYIVVKYDLKTAIWTHVWSDLLFFLSVWLS
ncbi:MAG: CPBP family intramembrane metalloprotease [Bacteroidetes bacterium]|nr:MAG: CPBP family intramembrane metalloprotease [Bacteroidota bacterium]